VEEGRTNFIYRKRFDLGLMAGLLVALLVFFSFFDAAESSLLHLFAELCCSAAMSVGIFFVNRYYFQHRYLQMSMERLSDNLRFFYDTAVASLLGLLVSDLFFLPVFFCIHHNGDIIFILFSQIALLLLMLCYSLVYHIVIYLKLYVQRNVELETLARDKIHSEISALQSQFSPHLIISTLDYVERLIPEDKTKAKLLLEDFSQILRYKIYEVKSLQISLKEELEYIQKYTRLINKLGIVRLQVNCSEPTVSVSIKPLLLQAVVDIVAKHCNTEVTVESSETDSVYEVSLFFYTTSEQQAKSEINNLMSKISLPKFSWRYSASASSSRISLRFIV